MESFEELWSKVCEYCRGAISETSYKSWIETISAAEYKDGTVTIVSCSEFRNSILKNKFSDLFKKAFEEIVGFDIDINFEVRRDADPNYVAVTNAMMGIKDTPAQAQTAGENANANASAAAADSDDKSSYADDSDSRGEVYKAAGPAEILQQQNAQPAANTQPQSGGSRTAVRSETRGFTNEESSFTPFMVNYTFDNFIVGESNKYAHAASWRVATSVPGSVYNPLYIYGRSGLGKTHLMLAIRDQFKKRNPGINTLYTTSEKFMNEFIACITNKDMAAFRDKYRNVDALFIDDIQFIKKKISMQEEFFHTFNELVNNGKQIVLTSDRPPKEIENLDERIKTRFESGLTADIHSPDIDTRTAIVIKKAEDFGLKLTTPMINYIAEKIKDNIRQIEGTIKKIAAMQSLNEIPTMTLIQDIIKDIATDTRPVSAVVEEIIEEIADKYEISKEDIVSEKRDAQIKNARNEAIFIIREVTGVSLENIGSYFGGKKHSTIKHSIDMVEERIKRDNAYKTSVYSIINNMRNS